MSQYRVNLEIFAGPLDLLLYLVRKDEVDIYDIHIARITKEYVRHVEMLKMLDVDLAGDFLVMAATLMEIKSAMLLPRPEVEEEDAEDTGDPRIQLVRQLLEYKKFKDAANLLQDSAENRKQRFTRPDSIIADLEPDAEPELDLDQISIWTLLEAFDEIMQATGRLHSYDHIKDDTPIDLYQIEILHRLQTEGSMTLEKAFQGRGNRLVMVGLFLAMLELIRDRLIWAEQPDNSGPIYLRALTDEPAEQAVQNAIYAATALEEEPPAEAQKEEESPADDQSQPAPQDDTLEADQPEPAPIPIQQLPPEKESQDHVGRPEPGDNSTPDVSDPDKSPRIPIQQLPPKKQPGEPTPVEDKT